jgi:PAS domain S-box-containing protein
MFRLLVASVKDYSIFLLDPQGYIRTWNEGAQRTKGYTADEIIGKHFSIFYSPQEVRHGKPEYGLRVAVDEGRWEEEGWRFRKDGTRFWADVVITALVNSEGELVGFAKVTRDLTERKRTDDERRQLLELERAARSEAEAALERLYAIQQVTDTALAYPTLEELLPVLLERVSEILFIDTGAVLLLDEDDPQVLVTRAAMGSALEGMQDVRLPFGEGLAWQVASEREPRVIDDLGSMRLPDPLLHGTVLRSVMGVPLLVNQRVLGVLYVGVLRQRRFSESDIQYLRIVADRVALAIDHARLHEAAQRARVEAEVAEATVRTQNEFLSIAAHELKTPLTSVKAAVQLLLRRYDRNETPNPAQMLRGLRTIEGQADRLARLVSRLLETTRLHGGRITLDLAWTNVTELVQEVVEQTQARAGPEQFVLVVPEAAWATVDRLRIEQVITNLLDNAIKFSPASGRIDITVDCPTEESVRLMVRDYGIGVPPEHRPHLFERFYQAHAESHQSGLGLGLYISREIVTLHGGTVMVEFPPDGGTCFVVTLPCARETPPPGSEPASYVDTAAPKNVAHLG